MAVLVQAVLFTVLPAQVAWRWMFAFGFLPAVFVLFVRRYVAEPPVAAAARAAAPHRLWDIFSADVIKTTLLASLLGTGAQGGYYAVTTWLPIFLQNERHLTIVGSTSYLAFLIAGAFSGYLVGAWLSDRIGRRKLFLVFSVGAVGIVLAYTQLPITNHQLWLLGFPLGFFASGYFAGMGAFLAEIFPTRVRGSGMGFAYNFGRGIGALFPALVGFLSTVMPLSHAIAIFATLAYSLLFIAAWLLPETRGKQLVV
jgi:MFS family permease